MFASRTLWAVAAVLLTPIAVLAQQRDPRDVYRTRSLEAARLLRQADELVAAKKLKEAVAAIDDALKADPRCQTAYFQKALALGETGDVIGAIAAYKTCLSDAVDRYPVVSANAANNIALTYGRLKEFDEACLWFTRAILEDSANQYGQRGKAYRNLAITFRNQNKSLPAAVAVALAFEDKAPNTDLRMVQTYLAQADREEAATLLHFPATARPAPRQHPQTLTPAPAVEVPEIVTELLPDPQGRFIVAVPNRNLRHYYVLDTAGPLGVRKVELAGPFRSACLAAEHLYAMLDGPSRLEKLEPTTGKVVETYPVKAPSSASLAVFPAQGRAYFPADQVIQQIDLTSGAVAKTNVPGQWVVGHAGLGTLYSYVKPEMRGGGGGHIIVNGRPIFFQTRNIDWQQTTLFESVLSSTGLLLAGVRDNAASNAQRLDVSPDGRWVAVAGGGGWRPTTQQAKSGYGVAVFDSRQLDNLQGFFREYLAPARRLFQPGHRPGGGRRR